MMKFLSGEEVRLVNYEYDERGEHVTRARYTSGRLVKCIHPVQLNGTPTIEEVNKFIRHTEQYNKSPKAVEGRLKKLDNAFGRTYVKSTAFAYELKDKKFEVEVGDFADCSLVGSGRLVTRSLALNVDLNRLKSCTAYIKFDDHAWLTVNSKAAWESLPGLGNGYRIEKLEGENWVITNECKVKAETGRSNGSNVDLKPFLITGINSVILNVIVENAGCAFMKIIYNQESAQDSIRAKL